MFKKVFASLIEKNNLSQTEAGRLVGQSPQTIYKWLNGLSNPGHEELKTVSRVFDVSIDTLLGNPRFAEKDGWLNVPVIEKVPPGNPVDQIEFHRTTLPIGADMAKLYSFGYIVQDRAMEGAGILYLDIVFVQYDMPAEDGAIFLVALDDRDFLARVFVQGKYFLLKREGNGFKPILIDTKKPGNFRLVGRVTGLFRPDMQIYEDPEPR